MGILLDTTATLIGKGLGAAVNVTSKGVRNLNDIVRKENQIDRFPEGNPQEVARFIMRGWSDRYPRQEDFYNMVLERMDNLSSETAYNECEIPEEKRDKYGKPFRLFGVDCNDQDVYMTTRSTIPEMPYNSYIYSNCVLLLKRYTLAICLSQINFINDSDRIATRLIPFNQIVNIYEDIDYIDTIDYKAEEEMSIEIPVLVIQTEEETYRIRHDNFFFTEN